MSSNKKDYDQLFKLVVIGDTGVGKSCILLRFVDNIFAENYANTIGVDFRFRTVKLDRKTVKLQIWDTAGQERFRTITSAYYRGADGIVMVYDVGSEDSFKHINDWFVEVNRYAAENTCKLLVGNKIDKAEKIISTERGQKLADELGIPFIETSALDATNIEQAFLNLSKELLLTRPNQSADPRSNSKRLSVASGEERKGCC
ncbi:Rab1 family GTPase putative [Ochromonadaceae sp. CCMP2298]|nr:Rab1 family GTPase putative [Ochromonadaceae sp. CCMP2298]|mmetsp:Transcript_35559/g.78305  ORF Transcript_35559/g.78305 Transcript_35559/m.78305 type:complete len:202 (-) Transcript_35559:162-767(-)